MRPAFVVYVFSVAKTDILNPKSLLATQIAKTTEKHPFCSLPIDPEWKRDYAATVRRLIRDGVDVPLANLFVHAARPQMAGDEGESRARSASEAFLFRRLQTLPETAGLFRLNVELPISEDAGKRLDQILDTTLAALVHCENHRSYPV